MKTGVQKRKWPSSIQPYTTALGDFVELVGLHIAGGREVDGCDKNLRLVDWVAPKGLWMYMVHGFSFLSMGVKIAI